MLMIPIISSTETGRADTNFEKTLIKVSILKGPDYFAHLQYGPQYNTLDKYSWIVDNQIYEFKPTIYVNEWEYKDEDRAIFLSNDNTDVLVNDGGSLDGTLCGLPGGIFNYIKNDYREYLDNGSGHIYLGCNRSKTNILPSINTNK